VEYGTKLGDWLNNQRKLKKKGKLYAERVMRLNKLSVVWESYAVDQSESNYELLCKIYENEGYINVRKRPVEDETNLDMWSVNERKSKKKGSIDDIRKE